MTADGGLRLVGPRAWSAQPDAESGGWTVGGDTPLAGARLQRAPGTVGGWLLLAPAGSAKADEDRELARTTPLAPGDASSPSYLLLADGRLFRIGLRDPRDPCFELGCWETGGPYLEARAEAQGWRIEPTVAGSELAGIDELPLLLAVAILDAEGRLVAVSPPAPSRR